MTDKDTHTAGTPRWVKVFGVIALVLVVLVVVMLVTGRGGHGPGRHTASGDTDGQGPAAVPHTEP
jgi:ABC-type transporter Mla subunit MlaD